MGLHGKTVIPLEAAGDIASIVVEGTLGSSGFVTLSVNDQDSDDSADGQPLITGFLSKDTAVRVARALLMAAGVQGTPRAGGATAYVLGAPKEARPGWTNTGGNGDARQVWVTNYALPEGTHSAEVFVTDRGTFVTRWFRGKGATQAVKVEHRHGPFDTADAAQQWVEGIFERL